jgi:hypothetical protein
VLAVSFHKSGEYFPSTGHLDAIGIDRGERYSVNILLKTGMKDESDESIFKPIARDRVRRIRPRCPDDLPRGKVNRGLFDLPMPHQTLRIRLGNGHQQ